MAPQRDSAGCRGVNGPYPQPLSMKEIACAIKGKATTYTFHIPTIDPRLTDLTLRSFGDDLASGGPVPGGGSAAAYAGVLGAALAGMVGRIALRKAEPGTHDVFISEADALRAEFLALVDEDASAFALVAAALKLPKSDEREAGIRRADLQTALVTASRVPLRMAAACRRLLEVCERGLEMASRSVISDIGVAALLAEAALRGAALNVMVNLSSLTDSAQVKTLSEELDRTLEGADEQRRRITDFVESRVAR